jgi:hypothetical protein
LLGPVTLADLLTEIVRALDAAGIPHMVAGSLASTLHGEPRSTQDIDLVIDPTRDGLLTFVAGLDRQRFYVADALSALERRDQFNVVDTTTGWKVDLIIRKERAFSRTEFERRQPAVILGVTTAVASVEDTILAKLEWAKAGDSDRQRRDVTAMISVQRATLAHDYLQHWAKVLDLTAELESAITTAEDR